EEPALLVNCLLAAGRSADADVVEREARRLDPSAAMRGARVKERGITWTHSMGRHAVARSAYSYFGRADRPCRSVEWSAGRVSADRAAREQAARRTLLSRRRP